MPSRHVLLAVLAAGLIGSPVAALAQSGPERAGLPRKQQQLKPTVERSKLLWATVNVCDTEAAPDTIGVRGSMPGAPDGRELMYMRFQVQYFSPADGAWHQVRQGGDSGFVVVGRARYESRQGGRSFRLTPKTESVILRGVVTFEWRSEGDVVRRARKRTTASRRSSAGADPAGFSASNCTITR